MLIHIVNRFENALGGSERAALELFAMLRERADVHLWSTGAPDPRLVAFPITPIGRERTGPRGGTLVIAGNYFPLADWLESAQPERLILSYNTVVGPALKYAVIDRLRRIAKLEILYESPLVRESIAIPGPVFLSLIDLQTFSPSAGAPNEDFVAGRLSRDVPEKHHPDDPALYRRLAAEHIELRIMGGTCLRSSLLGETRVALLQAGAQPAPQFLQGLDCFLYRTSDSWLEAGGRVVFEAMACGLPAVCHVRGGYASYIEHGSNGFLFHDNEEAFHIISTLKSDSSLRKRVGEAARRSMEQRFSSEKRKPYLDYFLRRLSKSSPAVASKRRIDFAWELGAGTGHVTTLLPIARAMQARGYDARFLLREIAAGSDLEGASEIPRMHAPIWVAPEQTRDARTLGEILHNFGYGDGAGLRQLIEAWRERLSGASAVIASVAPAAHIAARTLGIPSFEISQGFHVPPPTMPTPLLRDWLQVAPGELEAIDHRVIAAISAVLAAYGQPGIATIGELFSGRSVLLTYPELDIYTGRGTVEYFGIPLSGEGTHLAAWPAGRPARVFAYLYPYYKHLDALFAALVRLRCPTLVLCRGIDLGLREKYAGTSVFITEEPMAVSALLPQADIVACHASHQMSAQALLAGKPLLAMPTQLEQFLITRRVVRQGMGLGIAAEEAKPDFTSALEELAGNPRYTHNACSFATHYANHDRGAALATMIARCEAALA